MLVCLECERECKSFQSLRAHLIKAHNIKHKNYLIKYFYDGKAPLCKCGCEEETNYFRGKFKYYKQGHYMKVEENKKNVCSPDSYKKRTQTNVKKYGGPSPMASSVVRNKVKKTNVERYGGPSPASSTAVVKKMHKTTKERYGVEVPTRSPIVVEKIKKTCLEKYGVDNVSKNPIIIEKIKYKALLPLEEVEKRCEEKKYEIVSGSYDGCSRELGFVCKTHNCYFVSSMSQVSKSYNQCPDCRLYGKSKQEKEISEFIEGLGFETRRNVYNVITPKELDIFVDVCKFAVEHHGIYWHSEIFNPLVSKDLFYEKFMKCKEKNVELVQFYEDEWRDKQEICKSILSKKIGKVANKICATKCDILEDSVGVESFIDENHLQGNTSYIKSFALKNNGDIVSCVTLRKPFAKNENIVEIVRFCSKKNYVIEGAAKRFLLKIKQWCIKNNISQILAYSNCRYSSGKIYEKLGFEFKGHTGIDYFYTDGFNRFAQNEKGNKNYKIYDAGHHKWIFNIK